MQVAACSAIETPWWAAGRGHGGIVDGGHGLICWYILTGLRHLSHNDYRKMITKRPLDRFLLQHVIWQCMSVRQQVIWSGSIVGEVLLSIQLGLLGISMQPRVWKVQFEISSKGDVKSRYTLWWVVSILSSIWHVCVDGQKKEVFFLYWRGLLQQCSRIFG